MGQTYQYVFEPQTDIDAGECAMLLQLLLPRLSPAEFDQLQPEIRRHFARVPARKPPRVVTQNDSS